MRRSVVIAGFGVVALGLAGLAAGHSDAAAQPLRGAAHSLLGGTTRAVAAVSRTSVEALGEERRERERREAILAEHVRNMPDLTQTDPELRVEGGGDSWCGPVAVSNALMWLGEHGHEGLVPSAASEKARQLELARQLGSGRFMATTPTGGTGTGNLLRGLHRYLVSHGIGYRRLAYQGWRGHPYRFSTGVKIPSIEFAKQALDEGGIAVIHAGWYKTSRYGDFHRRNGGHWLTVVGVGIDEQGHPAPDVLVLNDPAPYAGSEPARHFARLERFESGWLLAEDGAFPAKGYAKLTGGMRIKREGDIAVLDGIVALVP